MTRSLHTRPTRIALIATVLVIAAGAGWAVIRAGSVPAESASAPAAPVVLVEEAVRAPISRTLELTGSVEAVQTAILASPAEGPVQGLRVREGDTVPPGALLLTIGRREAVDASLEYARESARRAAEELRRVAELVEMGALPSEELDQARVEHERARAQLQQAEQLSSDYQVRAPWRGVVSSVLVHEGNYVGPRAPLVELFDPGALVVRLAVPETGAAQVREGMGARIRLDAYPAEDFPGRISRVFPELDRETRTRTVEVVITGPALAPGMFARVTVELGRIPDAVVVPDAALLATPDGTLTAYVVRDGTVTRRQVVTGIEVGRRVQVLSGVEAGELVVVSGQRNLREGMAVRPRPATEGQSRP